MHNATKGDSAMTKDETNSTIKSIVEALEDQEMIIAAARDVQKEIYIRAAMNGYDKPIVRMALARRKRDRQDVVDKDAGLSAFEEELYADMIA